MQRGRAGSRHTPTGFADTRLRQPHPRVLLADHPGSCAHVPAPNAGLQRNTRTATEGACRGGDGPFCGRGAALSADSLHLAWVRAARSFGSRQGRG